MNRMKRLLVVSAIVVGVSTAMSAQGFFRGGPEAEMAVVERFDADKNGRLDTAERLAARKWLGGGSVFGRRRAGLSAAGGAAQQLTPEQVPSFGQAGLYDTATLRTIFLNFDNPDWASELASFYNTDVDVPATVTVDGQVYKEVGVHFRGASSYRMVGDEAKKSLNLAFNHAIGTQRLHGYRTLNLLNGNGDPSFVRTRLYSEIAGKYIPTPKTNYVRVVVNGENWGVYINSQQFNADFTREFYGSTRGARWKVPGTPRGRGGMEYLGTDAASYKRLYEIKTADNQKSWDALISMFRVLNETPPDKLEAALAPVLDIDGVLKFLALEVVLVNSDGYWTRASDYNIYLDDKGKFHVIPHDVNESMSEGGGFGGGFGGGGVMLDPLVAINDPGKPLRSRLLQVPALRTRYLGYVRDIATNWLDWNKLEPMVRQYRQLIAEDMKRDTHKLYSTSAFESGPASVKSFVDGRRAFLLKP
jgi:hypothetical protein